MKIKIILFLVLLCLFVPIYSKSLIVMPSDNLTIIVNTHGSDSSFSFKLQDFEKICTDEESPCVMGFKDLQELNLQTENLSVSKTISFVSFSNEYLLSEENIPGFKISSIACLSDNSKDKFLYQPNGVSLMLASGWDNIVCTFSNDIQQKTPVLIVPGLLGTEMKNGDELLWLDLGRMFMDIGDAFMNSLAFNLNLIPNESSVSPSNVIKNINIPGYTFDYTGGLINEFKNQGYTEGKDLFTFPYDWRYGASGKYPDGTTNADLLAQKVQDILQQTGSDKVDIVAHSLGGLIVKRYVVEHAADHYLGKVVFVGVPETGAPKAIKVLLQGDNFGIPWLSQNEMKKISQNLPVAYDLLPDQQYYKAAGSYLKIINWKDPFGIFTSQKNLDYSQSKSLLIDDHSLNSLAMAGAENLHSQDFDNADLSSVGIDVYSINGCQSGTISQLAEIRDKFIPTSGIYTRYLVSKMAPGDGTVPLYSAENLAVDQNHRYYALVSDHSKMPSQEGIRQQIVNIVSGSNLEVSRKLMTQDMSQCKLNGKFISVITPSSFMNPVKISVKDQDGNELKEDDNDGVISQIPNANIEIFEGQKFYYIPYSAGQTYTITIFGGHGGGLAIKSQDIINNEIAKTEVFNNIPTEPFSGEVNINPTDNSTTIVVNPDDGSPQETLQPTSTPNQTQAEDILPPVSVATLDGKLKENGTYDGEVKINVKATDSGDETGLPSGVFAINYSLDDSAIGQVLGDSLDLTVTSSGQHAFNFFAVDKAGNSEGEQTINFTIEKSSQNNQSSPNQEQAVNTTGGGGGNLLVMAQNSQLVTSENKAVQQVLTPPIQKVLVSNENALSIKIKPIFQDKIAGKDKPKKELANAIPDKIIPIKNNHNIFLASLGVLGLKDFKFTFFYIFIGLIILLVLVLCFLLTKDRK